MQVKVLELPKTQGIHWAEIGAVYEVTDHGVFWMLSSDKMPEPDRLVGAGRMIPKKCCEVVK